MWSPIPDQWLGGGVAVLYAIALVGALLMMVATAFIYPPSILITGLYAFLLYLGLVAGVHLYKCSNKCSDY